MKIAVFDTHVTRPDGRVMHFDILVPEVGKDIQHVLVLARSYLRAKGIPADQLRATRCRFCHMEMATQPVEHAIREHGFAVLELEHCD